MPSADKERRYGYYRCPRCKRKWESSLAWCYRGTNEPVSGQKCKNCVGQMIKPYKVDSLRCKQCYSSTGCRCIQDHHVDISKKHESSLCELCQSGQPCRLSDPRRREYCGARVVRPRHVQAVQPERWVPPSRPVTGYSRSDVTSHEDEPCCNIL